MFHLGIYEPSRGPGGPSRYVEAILSELDPEEFAVTIFGLPEGPYADHPGFVPTAHGAGSTLAPASGDVPAGRASSDLRRLFRKGWIALSPEVLKLWAGFGRDCRRLSRIFRRRPVDLLHTNNTGCEESPVAARLAGVPAVVGTFHVDSTYDLEGQRSGLGHRVLEVLSNRCLHRAIAVSQATKDDWVRRTGIPPGRVVTIPNGVDPEAFQRRVPTVEARRRLGLFGEDALVIGGVGRLDEAKGFTYLIEAVSLLAKDYPQLVLAIAGDGPLRSFLAERAAALGVADRVRFLGFRRDVRPVFEALDVFVFSSLCEAIGYALLESMAVGLPAVGTRVGGVPEVIVPGETGFLVPPRDPQALAAALRNLLESPALRGRMGEAGRTRVSHHFHERETVRRTIDVYRQMLSLPPRPILAAQNA